MIGDKDIDETSDLSEYLTNSDEDTELELTLPVENESLNRISGYYDDNKTESINSTVNTLHSKELEFLNEQCNNNILNRNTSIIRDSNIPTDIVNSSQINKVENQEHNIGINRNIQDVDHHCLTYENEYSDKEVQLNAPPKPGSIAEREHKKWESATSIKNNPYSKENIQKRFLEKKYIGPFDLSRFTRDCYIDNRIVSNIETKRSVVSDSLTKSISDINYNKSNQNECNLEIQENIKFIKPNLPISSNKDLILTTNLEKHYNKPILNTTVNDTNEEVLQVVSDESMTLESTKNNKMLEHERRYNKNEIQAKLNNQDHILDGINEVVQSDQPLCNEKWSIREMDLKACEFDKNDLPKLISNLNSIDQEGMNKLDTQPLNYLESSIVKSQSINELDNQTYKEIGYKSNLINNKQIDTVDSIKIADIDGDFLLDNQTKTNVILEKDNSEVTSTIITPCKASVTCNSENIIENKLTKYETEIITAKLFNEKRDFYHGKSVEHFSSNGKISNNNNCIEKKLSMPSVKQLVQVFDKKYQETITSNLVAESKSDELERKGIKSIQSRRTISRQLHSLTARSLSKEFREGLRQIPNKTRMHNLKYKKILQ
ncbi:PREDICTED: putative uncharacterized protein DDB_G0290989 [Ceratosolen solmsi marchali]|uniref:Uncharacterized protein n=1 Tax=Ceratosolen solmsi marchali TaxID=326594 RepID=A0AAJ6YUR6_9HYME|nr:PREDICTED: putative uncharacterized protein DDB_G0290989 [Ceratosolen solmsi marchali]